MSDPRAEKIVRQIIADLKTRKGLKQEWEAIDGQTARQIERHWTALVERELYT